MTTRTNVAALLERVIGAPQIVSAEEELQSYSIDGMAPSVIVRPARAEQVAEVVRCAAIEKLAILPCGSRSKLELGMPPSRYDIAMDMTGMQHLAHYDPGDLTLSVEAGMPLRKLEATLAEKHQFLPLAVPCYEASTVGGAVASGIDSVFRQLYGTARDFLIGADFVDGKGNACKSGGRVVKNVTGYDLHKLLIGSLGTLGVITRLNFRTFPLPQTSEGHVARFTTMERALSYRAALEDSGLPLTNLEVLSPEIVSILTAILRQAGAEFPVPPDSKDYCVYASYEGNAEVVRRIAHDFEGTARNNGAAQGEVLEPRNDENLGGMLREAFEWLRWASPSVLLFRIVLPKIAPDNISELARTTSGSGVRSVWAVRAAGIIYLATLGKADDAATLDTLEKIAREVFGYIVSRQGHATLLHAPAELKTRVNVWGPERKEFALMKRVKQAFDPYNILAPGRFVGGL